MTQNINVKQFQLILWLKFGKESKDVITVPIQAIFQDENGNNIVYTIKSDTLITSKIVKTGINDLEKVEIIEGIAVGDTISLKEKPKTDSENDKRRRGRIRIN